MYIHQKKPYGMFGFNDSDNAFVNVFDNMIFYQEEHLTECSKESNQAYAVHVWDTIFTSNQIQNNG